SRHLMEKVIAAFQSIYGEHLEMDLVTCYQGQPQGFRGRVFRVTDYGGAPGRNQLLAELAERRYPIAGIICAAEPIMTKWKWWLAVKLPAKMFIINENADYFWLDWGHWKLLARFVLYRAGLTGTAAVPALVRLVFFPVTLSYLVVYALMVHL